MLLRRNETIKAPFPYFGGKSRIAPTIWSRLGNPQRFIEPFVGSAATLLGRPGIDFEDPPNEVINDLDGYLVNAWRAIAYSPGKLIELLQRPIVEADLVAVNNALTENRGLIIPKLKSDEMWNDVEIAAKWLWGISAWLGSGFSSVIAGVKKPVSGRCGVNCYHGEELQKYIQTLHRRLRGVLICNGSWERVLSDSYTGEGYVRNAREDGTGTYKSIGVVLDPPYKGDRVMGMYDEDSAEVWDAAADWCREHGDDPTYRIALCGYEGYVELPGWEEVRWKAVGGFSGSSKDRNSQAVQNASRETVWFSPHCYRPRNLLTFRNGAEQQDGVEVVEHQKKVQVPVSKGLKLRRIAEED